MKTFSFLLLSFSFLVSSAPAADYLIIGSGQSNMGGVAKTKGLPDELKPMPANVLCFRPFDTTQPLEPMKSFDEIPKFGPMPSFLHELSQAHPTDRFIVLHDSVGGSSLASWVPDYGPAELSTRPGKDGSSVKLDLGKNYTAMAKRLAVLRKAYPEAKPLAFLWIQGESDSGKWAEAYLENFKRLVANIRRDAGAPDLFVIVAEPGKTEEVVRQAFRDYVQQDPQSALVPGQDLSKGQVHYDGPGYIELGRRLAKELEAYLAKKP
jgi:hypothetical protein